MVLGTTSQSVVWLNISDSPVFFGDWGGVATVIHWIVWVCGLTLLLSISITYTMKAFWWWGAVLREINHPFRVNFFFGPLIGTMFLANGTPLYISDRTAELPNRTPRSLAVIVMTILLVGELYVYREWIFSEGLSIRNNNPSFQIAVVGNFVGGAMLTRAGFFRVAKFFWSVGVLFWLLLFISLFQSISKEPRRDSSGRRTDIWRFPSTAHPTLFLFIAAPSAAGTSWAAISSFDDVSIFFASVALFIAMFMLTNIRILAQTPFTVSWWAYTFPIGAISIVYTRSVLIFCGHLTREASPDHRMDILSSYAESLDSDGFLKYFAFILSLFSSFMVLSVFFITLFRLYSADWTINPDTGKVKNPGLFPVDPVIKICLHKMSKAIHMRSRDEKDQIAISCVGTTRDSIKQSRTSAKFRGSVTTGTGEHVVELVRDTKVKMNL
mmetsp:Transcript_1125/g.2137  ORF Transcript_1125/g.2137 Transcript_1125/m.2137 type:complete len:439 (-) Transcript_1125:440-1756(-)